MEHTVILLYW